jgi:hypothetical protein
MASWIQVRDEIVATKTPQGVFDFDKVRRGKLAALEAYTSRPVILYASDFTNPIKANNAKVQMDLDDKVAFKDVIEVLVGDAVDVLLYLPGGSAEATESIVDILRSRFKSVRFIVPHAAKSAATMLAMSGDSVLADQHSELGPIDPQFFMKRGNDVVIAPAQAIVEQFEEAQKLLAKNAGMLPAWIPILQQYGPALYQQAKHSSKLASTLVSTWLRKYMFAGEKDKKKAAQKARTIANRLNSHARYKSHGRRIGIDELQQMGVKVLDMRTDPKLQELAWDIQYAVDHTFSSTGAIKIVENAHGRCIVRLMAMPQIIQVPQQVIVPGQPAQ